MRQLYIHLSLRIGGLRRQAETWHLALRLLAAAPAPRLSQPAARLLPPEGNLRPGGSSAECLNTDDPVSSPRPQVLQLGPAAEEHAGGLPRGPTARHAGYPAADGGPDCTSLHFTTPQRHHSGCHSGTAGDKVLSDKRRSFHPRFKNIELVLVVCSSARTCRHMQVMGHDTTRAYSMTDVSDKDEHDKDMTG